MPVRFGMIGTGWRADYFARMARALPDRAELVGVAGRTPERVAEFAGRWGVRAHGSVAEMIGAERPDFVIVSVAWEAAPGQVRAVVDQGVRVLCETPPAPDLAGLRDLWASVGSTGLVQVAEQYPLMPTHASRLALVRSGAIGRPTSVQVSSTHLYHAVALIRAFLGGGFTRTTVDARAFIAPLINPASRAGWSDDDIPQAATTTIATIDFGETMGLYDFTDNQWHNQLRARRMVIRGTQGEIVDDHVVRLSAPRTIVRSPLTRRQIGYDLDLDGYDTDHISLGDTILYRNPFQGLRLSDDEIGVAAILAAMADWCAGLAGPPYPLAEACQDHLIGLAIGESAALGAPVSTATEAWASR